MANDSPPSESPHAGRGQVRLAIVHGQGGFRAGLRVLLESEADLKVVGDVDSIEGVAAMLAGAPVDILLLYERISAANLKLIGQLSNRVAVIAVVDESREGMAMPAVRAGARGVVLNHLAIDGLTEAIRTVALGYVSIPPSLQAQVVADIRQTSSVPLTARERDVTRLVATGLRNGEIAGELSISEQTVKKHLNNIFQKLELRDRVELARYALRTALVGGATLKMSGPGLGKGIAGVRSTAPGTTTAFDSIQHEVAADPDSRAVKPRTTC